MSWRLGLAKKSAASIAKKSVGFLLVFFLFVCRNISFFLCRRRIYIQALWARRSMTNIFSSSFSDLYMCVSDARLVCLLGKDFRRRPAVWADRFAFLFLIFCFCCYYFPIHRSVKRCSNSSTRRLSSSTKFWWLFSLFLPFLMTFIDNNWNGMEDVLCVCICRPIDVRNAHVIYAVRWGRTWRRRNRFEGCGEARWGLSENVCL